MMYKNIETGLINKVIRKVINCYTEDQNHMIYLTYKAKYINIFNNHLSLRTKMNTFLKLWVIGLLEK